MKKIYQLINRLYERPLLFCITLSLLLNLVIESLSRRSIIGGFVHLFAHPANFLYNSLIILLTLSLALLIKRRTFALSIVTLGWLGLGIADCIIRGFRTTPLRAVDFRVIKSAISLINIYFNPLELVLIIIAIALVIVGIVYIWIKAPKQRTYSFRGFLMVSIIGITLILATDVSAKAGVISTTFENIANAYENYGFVYCFSRSVVDIGINKPEDYSEEMVASISNKIGDESPTPEKTPNIIMLQLESFFDVARLKNMTFSEDPIPVFHSLLDNYSSGLFKAPVIGAGTANTEFEVITQMTTEYFGSGEYPYTTILQESTSESVPYNLKELGYTAHAIHNNTGTFYDRNLIYSMLGFDTFTSSEYMKDLEETPLGWYKDKVLIESILNALSSTDGQDYLYTISVQGHGKYPTTPVDYNKIISVTSDDLTEGEINAMEYYVNQLREMDNFIKELVETLNSYEEPVVLVLYGDHLPSLNIQDEDLSTGDTYTTEYVIWSNFEMENKNRDLAAWQLSSEVLDRLGIDKGTLTRFHQRTQEQEDYKEMLHALQYDMLYGKKYIYNQEAIYEPTELKMGVLDIKLTDYELEASALYVSGENFTEWSRIYVNDDPVETVYIDENTLMTEDIKIEDGDSISVKQVSKGKEILSSTSSLLYYSDIKVNY
ncbi:LTA synthase family protein [Alloiococcus sp. CFN-8]|uniref:LTA synthase family protein n=1 Tax=Alloiococcus sp. CFN-8 TaxID=3416081 RepID=UPI003CF0AECC